MLIEPYAPAANCDVPITEWAPEDIAAHIDFQRALGEQLAAADARRGAGPCRSGAGAHRRSDGRSAPVVTDGPSRSRDEGVPGGLLDHRRRLRRAGLPEVAAQASAAPGPGESRSASTSRCARSRAPRSRASAARLPRPARRAPGPWNPCCGSWARRCWRSWSAASATSTPPRTPSRTRCWPPPQWRRPAARQPARLADPGGAAADGRRGARRVARRRRETEVFVREVPTEAITRDDSLELYLLCCHPELPKPGRWR